MKLSFLILFFFGSVSLFAAETSQKKISQQMSLSGGESFHIRGFHGKISVIGDETLTKIQVDGNLTGTANDFEQWKFTLQRDGKDVSLSVRGTSEAEGWQKIREGKAPHLNLRVRAPSGALSISWGDGDVAVNNWQGDVKVSGQSGKVNVVKGKGDTNILWVNGAIKVSQRQGGVQVQSSQGQGLLSDIVGNVRVSNQGARYNILKLKGNLDLHNYNGPVQVTEMAGALTLQNGRGAIKIKKHRGSVKGKTDRGEVRAQVHQLQEFQMDSQSGAVVLRMAKGQGALVSLRSQKGKLVGGPTLRKIKKGRWTELRGKVSGKDLSQVKIVSLYGDIVVR